MSTQANGLTLEDVRDFWNDTPCNTTRSSLPLGTKEFYDDITRQRYFIEPHILEFADFKVYKDKKVLEIGCGLGTDTLEFAKAGAHVTAVDYSQHSLELASERAHNEGFSVRFVHANAEELSKSLSLETYDLIYSFGVLHHTPNPERAYREVVKYMDKNSRFKLMVYHSRSLKALGVILRRGPINWRKKLAYYSEAKEGSPITYVYTAREITDLLGRCGLKVDALEIRYLWMRWYLKWMPGPLLRFVEHTFGWNICLTASLR